MFNILTHVSIDGYRLAGAVDCGDGALWRRAAGKFRACQGGKTHSIAPLSEDFQLRCLFGPFIFFFVSETYSLVCWQQKIQCAANQPQIKPFAKGDNKIS